MPRVSHNKSDVLKKKKSEENTVAPLNKKEYRYHLPQELIAQKPAEKRTGSRLMIIDPQTKKIVHKKFTDINQFIKKDDIVVINTSRVWKARVTGKKQMTGGKIEILVFDIQENGLTSFLAKPAKKLKQHTIISFGSSYFLKVSERTENHAYGFFYKQPDEIPKTPLPMNKEAVVKFLEKNGTLPLPPYIKTAPDSPERYQTVYAQNFGSSAAPTAGLHFDNKIIEKLKRKGVTFCEVELHVGPGTFEPVKSELIKDHKMHEEHYHVPSETADILNKALKENRKIISIGTTTLRTLEANLLKYGKFKAESGETDIFIYPPYKIKSCNALLTNFHLPESTLLMLTAAFAGYDFIKQAYQTATNEKYRFFSFGDAMLINGKVS